MLEIKILFGGGFYIQYKVLWPLFPLIHLISFTTFRRLEIQSLNQTAVGFTFTFMHLANALIQSDLQCIQAIYFLSVCVFPGSACILTSLKNN